MYISLLDIVHFGGISGMRLELKPGLEVFYGPNESGKTTIYHFIRMMFYSKTERGKEISNNPRKRNQPWDKSAMEGSLEFWWQEKQYRLYKRFGQTPGQDETQLICLTTQTEVELPKEQDVGEYLFGLSLPDYDRIVCASINGMFRTSGKEDSYAGHLLEPDRKNEPDYSASVALTRLEHAMEDLVSKRGDQGKLVEQRECCRILWQEKKESEEFMEKKQELLDGQKMDPADAGKLKLAGWMIMTAFIATVLLGIFQNPFFFLAALVFALLYGAVRYYERWQTTCQRKRKDEADHALEEFLSRYGKRNPDTVAREYRLAKEEQDKMEAYYKSLAIARELLSQALEEQNASFLPQLNREAGDILSRLTNGAYRDILIDDTFQVQVQARGRYRESGFFSAGTRQQIYLAIRLAVAGRLQRQGESYPLILDELFSGYDDSRLEDTMDFLREYAQGSKEQVLLFTANRVVADLAADVEHPVILLDPVRS
ncbi:MAG: AAA family ATPase [Clostridiales bacterium]|nr:AAA family ATPase [Clostridiales bacterium]